MNDTEQGAPEVPRSTNPHHYRDVLNEAIAAGLDARPAGPAESVAEWAEENNWTQIRRILAENNAPPGTEGRLVQAYLGWDPDWKPQETETL